METLVESLAKAMPVPTVARVAFIAVILLAAFGMSSRASLRQEQAVQGQHIESIEASHADLKHRLERIEDKLDAALAKKK